MSRQIFVLWYESMYRFMTFATHRDRDLHLLSSKTFFEPFVRVATSRNEVVLGRPALWLATAKFAG